MSEAVDFKENYHILSEKRLVALDTVDRMPAGLRECVHEFGLPIVTACINRGIKKPGDLRELVREIWEGARQPCQTRNPDSLLDWVLMKSECGITAAMLLRILAFNNMAIVSTEPTRKMLNASMNECSTFNERVTKEEKHKRRLRAAIKAGAKA